MDIKTAQKQLVPLITEHLSESIPVTRILTYKPSSNGAVTGRFEAQGRVYNFVFNGMDARYKPAMNTDSALFSEYYLERFDTAPTKVRGVRALPKCTSKSYSCKGGKGIACIPLTNNCRMANTAIGNERLVKIKAMSKFLAANGEDAAKIEATRAKIVEGRMALAAENRAKREPKKIEEQSTKSTSVESPKKEVEGEIVTTKTSKLSKSAEKKIRDNAEKIASSSNVSEPEAIEMAQAIKRFTGGAYGKIREAESKGRPYKFENKINGGSFDVVESINRFIDKSPKYEGEIHRGLRIKASEMDSFLQNAKEGLVLNAMSSFSKNLDVAKGFSSSMGEAKDKSTDETHSVILSVKNNKSGADVSALSAFQREGEVIAPSGTFYKIVNVRSEKRRKPFNETMIHYIEIEEVSPEKQKERRSASK